MAANMDIVEYLTETVERNRYFYGKLMTVRDFLQEQQYFNNKRWLINRLLFGTGIVCGLDVRPAGQTEVEVSPGVALDQLGREITVLRTERVDLKTLKITPLSGAPPRRIRLCLAYHECPKEPVPSVRSSPCDEVCESNRVSETFTFEWQPVPTNIPPDQTCEEWLNRRTVARDTNTLHVERIAPVWVREGEVFEVALKVTATADTTGVRLTETIAGGGKFIEPTPASYGQPSQFPTPPVDLRRGEFFIYVYQVQPPTHAGANVTLASGLVPQLASVVEVVNKDEARRRETEMRFSACETFAGDSPCVPIADVTVTFLSGQVNGFRDLNILDAPRGYNLERVGRLLDCLREHMQAEAGSPRPGHAFITFKDTESAAPKSIAPEGKAAPGTSFTVSRGDHTHSLLFTANSGLEFPDGGTRLRINGAVGGDKINFLNPVSGQTPTEPAHLVTKRYVDTQVAGLDWQESVQTKNLAAPPSRDELDSIGIRLEGGTLGLMDKLPLPKPPISPPMPPTYKPGQRPRFLLYRTDLTGAWAGHHNQIAEWSGDEWLFTQPDEATAVFVEDESVAYLFTHRKWTPFLATPDLAAGRGLYAIGAFLNVGEGPGLRVGDNDVTLNFFDDATTPITYKPSPGGTTTVARGDHTHELPLGDDSGLEFADFSRTDEGGRTIIGTGLRVNGAVGGDKIDFLNPVSGQLPTLPRHLTTKQYVDSKIAGLDWQESVVTKEQKSPPIFRLIRGAAAGDEMASGDATSPLGGSTEGATSPPREAAGSPPSLTSPPSPPTSPLSPTTSPLSSPIIIRPPLPGPRPGARYLLFYEELSGAWAGHQNYIATWEGGEWVFTRPDEGTAVFVEDESVAYLFTRGKWTPFLATPSVAAGHGLYADGPVLSVGSAGGVIVLEDAITLDYEARETQPVTTAPQLGELPTVARGDHSHAFPVATEGGIEYADAPDREDEGSFSEATDMERERIEPERFQRGFRVNGLIGGRHIVFRYPVSGAEPVNPEHLVTKRYVDNAIAGLDWQASVLGIRSAPPDSPPPARGDRYLVMGDKLDGVWAERGDTIATWMGTRWSYTRPNEGMATFVEDENIAYIYADGKWTQFLAAPQPIEAGGGLVSDGNRISVGQGDGIVVRDDDVSVVFQDTRPSPIGTKPASGESSAAARGDHSHELPLIPGSGLEFIAVTLPAAGDERPSTVNALQVNGAVGGAQIEFLYPVSGQPPSEPFHLATKEYVDAHAAPPQNIAAGDGLTRTGDTLAVGTGAGVVVGPDTVSVRFEATAPPAIGAASAVGQANSVARGDHTHALPLGPQGGLEFNTQAGGLRVNGTVNGVVTFQNPVSGQTPTAANHLATRGYVDSTVGLTAGPGLTRSGNTMSVSAPSGSGLIAQASGLSVSFSNIYPSGLAETGNPGSLAIAARADHVHPMPIRTPGTSTGDVFFNFSARVTHAESAFIPLDTFESTLFTVQLGLMFNGRFITGDIMGNSAANAGTSATPPRDFPAMSLAADISLGGVDGRTWGFRVLAVNPQGLPLNFTVRYYVFRPLQMLLSPGTAIG